MIKTRKKLASQVIQTFFLCDHEKYGSSFLIAYQKLGKIKKILNFTKNTAR